MSESEDRAPMPPRETINDWIRFLAERPSRDEIRDWLTLRAAEIGWTFYDLSLALFVGVQKPALVDETDEPLPQ